MKCCWIIVDIEGGDRGGGAVFYSESWVGTGQLYVK